MIADPVRHFGRLSRGDGPRLPETGAGTHVLRRCHRLRRQPCHHPDGLDRRLPAGDGTHGAMPAAEFDGDDDMVEFEIDPSVEARKRLSPFGPSAQRTGPRCAAGPAPPPAAAPGQNAPARE
ncbi:hypothetical protein HGG75_17665 [Ochrobactrum pseudogrignonense]|nr:hypothetical protein [Brucella pseudogrignonensis]